MMNVFPGYFSYLNCLISAETLRFREVIFKLKLLREFYDFMKNMLILPFPFTSISPLGSNLNLSMTRL
jgi:hypothetical protein